MFEANPQWLAEVKEKLEEAGFKVKMEGSFGEHHSVVVEEPIPQLVPGQEHRIWLDDTGYLRIVLNFVTPEWENAQEPEEFERALEEIEKVHIYNLSMFFTCLYSSGENVIEDAEFEDMIEYSIDIYFGFVPPEEIVEVMESLRKETQYEVQKMQQESNGISSPS